MSDRNDIIDGSLAENRRGGLVYTKKCGWIDLGHARPSGANDLWDKIKNERAAPENDLQKHLIQKARNEILGNRRSSYFVIRYGQMMSAPLIDFNAGVGKYYAVKKGLSLGEKQSVALAIFLAVSHAFESFQQIWLARAFTNSGYSVEDMISNLLGFYRAMNPATPYIRRCDPVSKDLALQIWDEHGAVGSIKNRTLSPYLFHDGDGVADSRRLGTLPSFLSTIQAADEGDKFFEIEPY